MPAIKTLEPKQTKDSNKASTCPGAGLLVS